MNLTGYILTALLAMQPVSVQMPGQADDEESQDYYDAVATYPVEALAGVLGELHYLSYACEGEETQTWRASMMELLELEAPTRGAYRDRLVENFNDGYRYHQRRRTRCGAEAEVERQRLALQGRALTETLTREYID